MRLAFYAPLKPPDHPVPSGDRRMAQLLVQAWEKAGHQVELASRLTSRRSEGTQQSDVAAAAAEERQRLLALSERTGFRAQTIEVMDGSKRSGHSNAFFTGFGRFRRIVLFDTLVAQLAQDELEAVLAHEIGHYKRGHIPKRLVTSALLQFGAFGIIAWLARAPWFNAAFGLPADALAPTFLLFGLLGGLVTFWFTPIGNWISRKHEYEADAFARNAMGAAAPMTGALRKLAQKNLTNLTPHPLYSAIYYSHPTIVERERALAEG